MRKVAYLSLIALLVLAGSALAQTGTVVGTVQNSLELPAEGARVSLHDGTQCLGYVLTDANGAFSLVDVAVGTYTLRVGLQRVGQATVEGVEVVDGGQTVVPMITLGGCVPHGPKGHQGPQMLR
jgi:hypothetical protein